MTLAPQIENVLDSGRAVDNSAPIQVYFTPSGQTWTENGETNTSSGWNTYEINQAMLALEQWSNVADLEFDRTTVESQADFTLNTTNLSGSSIGYFYLPGNYFEAGIGVFDDQYAGWSSSAGGGLEMGGHGFNTMLHEFGHGLGLNHPHSDNVSPGAFPGVDSGYDTGHHDLNQGVNTVLSYIDGWAAGPLGETSSYSYGHAATPMAFDIAVIQKIYGANTNHNGGNTTYSLDTYNGNGTSFSCIWDTGGTDTIVNTSNTSSVIDLRGATLQLEDGGGGYVSNVTGVYGGFTIANSVTIENATGGGGSDTLIGNTSNNTLLGNNGNDTLYDTLGNDTLRGGNGNDVVQAEFGANLLIGGQGSDHIKGGSQSDTLRGENGNDAIQGELAQSLWGGSDKIVGGGGNDILMGGGGADEFIFYTSQGNDTIASFDANSVTLGASQMADFTGSDFVSGLDQITLKDFSAGVQSNVMNYVSIQNGSAVFQAEGTKITFYQVTDIDQHDFSFG